MILFTGCVCCSQHKTSTGTTILDGSDARFIELNAVNNTHDLLLRTWKSRYVKRTDTPKIQGMWGYTCVLFLVFYSPYKRLSNMCVTFSLSLRQRKCCEMDKVFLKNPTFISESVPFPVLLLRRNSA